MLVTEGVEAAVPVGLSGNVSNPGRSAVVTYKEDEHPEMTWDCCAGVLKDAWGLAC